MKTHENQITIRPFRKTDIPKFYARIKKDQIAKNLRKYFPRTYVEVKALVKASRSGKSKDYAVEFKGYLAGVISLIPVEGDPNSFELGCLWIAKRWRKRGLSELVICKLARQAFEKLGATKVCTRIFNCNEFVKELVLKLGFVYNPEHNCMMEHAEIIELLCFYEMTPDRLAA